MSDRPEDEITLKEAAEQFWRPAKDQPGWSKDGKYKAFTIEELVTDPEEIACLKRAREVKNGTATLDAMLASNWHGKTIRGQK